MIKEKSVIWIFAHKYNNEYVAETIVANVEDSFAAFEYGDTKEANYQFWEYPSGRIFDVVPDRELSEAENYYATPYGNKGTLWLPKLTSALMKAKSIRRTINWLIIERLWSDAPNRTRVCCYNEQKEIFNEDGKYLR